MKHLKVPLMALALFLVGCGSSVMDSVSDHGSRPDGGDAVLADYFPLQDGLTWTYEDGSQPIRVTGTNPSIYGPIYSVAGFLQDRVLRKTWDGKVMELRGDSWRLLFDLSAGEKATWTIQADGEQTDLLDGATVTVESRSARVETPYGAYANGIRLSVRPRSGLFDAGVSQMWFAPGVGLVKWSESWIGGERVHALTDFGVAGAPARQP